MQQLLGMLTGDQNQSNLNDIMEKFGLDENQARNALSSLLPGVSQGIQQQVQAENGTILEQLTSGAQQQYLDDDNAHLYDDAAVEEGKGLLGQIFGGEENTQQLIGSAAEKTGLDTGILQQMMPMVASMAMGGIGKQISGLGGLSSAGGLVDMVSSMIDTDGDGLDFDDVKNLAGKFFR